jgi:hypothetical protein
VKVSWFFGSQRAKTLGSHVKDPSRFIAGLQNEIEIHIGWGEIAGNVKLLNMMGKKADAIQLLIESLVHEDFHATFFRVLDLEELGELDSVYGHGMEYPDDSELDSFWDSEAVPIEERLADEVSGSGWVTYWRTLYEWMDAKPEVKSDWNLTPREKQSFDYVWMGHEWNEGSRVRPITMGTQTTLDDYVEMLGVMA